MTKCDVFLGHSVHLEGDMWNFLRVAKS